MYVSPFLTFSPLSFSTLSFSPLSFSPLSFSPLSFSPLSLTENKYFCSAAYAPRSSRVSVVSDKSSLLPSAAASGYYKLHTQMSSRSSSSDVKQLFSSVTFIPNLSIHKGAIFKCHISYKGKDKIVAERVSDRFTIQGQRSLMNYLQLAFLL